MTHRARVLLADDHAMVAEGLATLLQTEFTLAGAAADGRALLEQARRLRPDVVVSDLTMPGMTGLEALRALAAEAPEVRVVILTMHAEPRLAVEALRAGAAGFVLKEAAGDELLLAVREACEGRVYVTPRIAREVIPLLLAPARDGEAADLTPRQREVLRLVAEGRSMKQVASVLRLSRRTAESHKYRVMRVVGARTTVELVRHAIRLGLVPVPALAGDFRPPTP